MGAQSDLSEGPAHLPPKNHKTREVCATKTDESRRGRWKGININRITCTTHFWIKKARKAKCTESYQFLIPMAVVGNLLILIGMTLHTHRIKKAQHTRSAWYHGTDGFCVSILLILIEITLHHAYHTTCRPPEHSGAPPTPRPRSRSVWDHV